MRVQARKKLIQKKPIGERAKAMAAIGMKAIRKTMVRKTISLEEHEAIAPQLLEMQQGLDNLIYALFLSYPLDAPANRAVRKMGDACRELRRALQTEAERLDAESHLYLPAKENPKEEYLKEENV